MKFKAKDISTEVSENGGSRENVDWTDLSADGYDAVIIDDRAYSFSRFGLERRIDMADVIL